MKLVDRTIGGSVHKSTRTFGPFEYLMAVSAASFNNEITAFIWALALIQLPWVTKSLLMATLVPGLTLFLVFTLKVLISRDRPTPYQARCRVLKYDFRTKERSKSMPSGDSAQAGAFWTYMALNNLVAWPFAVAFTAFTMAARVYYMCHYPSDTIVGASLGACVALTLDYLL